MIQVERMVRNLYEVVQIQSKSREKKVFIKYLYRKFTDLFIFAEVKVPRI